MEFKSRLTPFEFWTQRTLPQVYDESLSFYELLNKVVNYLNDVIESQNLTNDNFVELNNLFTELKDFVDNYFANLDVQDEINSKLDDMVLDGTLDTIINQNIFNDLNTTINNTKDDLEDRGVNLKTLGAKIDGVTDDTAVVLAALQNHDHLVFEGTLCVSDTIRLGRGKTLRGLHPSTRGYGATATIKYIGALNRNKSVILLGAEVGAEPTLDASNVQVRDLRIDGNNLIGFCIYGTYLTNETWVHNIVAMNSLEYNMYFARGWYATLTRLTSLACKGKGIALGMPLEYQDGTKVNWVAVAPLELNNLKIDDIRSHSSGTHYSIDNPGLYNPTNALHRRHGYGIGCGIGNGMRLENFLSEGSGGVNLYVYTESQPSKNIRNGYLENSCKNSGLDVATTLPNIIIEHTTINGGAYEITDLFTNYHSGGIYFLGEGREVWLKNVHQPRFLKALDGKTTNELYAIVLKDNVYYGCGYWNRKEELEIPVAQKVVNTRYTWDVTFPSTPGGHKAIYVKGLGTAPIGSIIYEYDDGTTTTASFPSLTTGVWTHLTTLTGRLKAIKKGGGTDVADSNVEFRVTHTKPTYF